MLLTSDLYSSFSINYFTFTGEGRGNVNSIYMRNIQFEILLHHIFLLSANTH
jgi:hypothetical protein